MKCIFTADLHGNMNQYKLLFERAKDADVIIIGGDIAPKGSSRIIADQKRFVKELLPLLEAQSAKIFIMPGNDDFASCLDEFRKYDGLLGEAEYKGIKFIGYPFVPVTPFANKDWEKWDNYDQPMKFIRLEGVKSSGDKLMRFRFNPNNKNDTIENDLKKYSEKAIYVFHAPPFGTKLDMISPDVHVGSRAIKEFIERVQPPLTLHGHIHETVDVSGGFIEQIGNTKCIAVGNYHDRTGLAIIEFDTETWDVKREIV